MRRVILLISLLAMPLARGQESTSTASLPEIVENYKILKGQVENLQDANTALKHQIDDLQSKVDALTAQQSKPSGDYASQDDIKALKDAIKEVDNKRVADNELIVTELNKILKMSKAGGATIATPHPTPATTPNGPVADNATKPDGPGFTYEVKPNDTPNRIAKKLLEEKGIKITSEQIMQANPQVKDPTKLWIGQKLFIPLPKGTPDTANNN